MKNPIRWFIPVMFMIACTPEAFEVVEESYPEGTPKVVRYYNNESMEVLLKETQYYDDGSKYIEGTFKNGERNGTWQAWYRDGKLWSQGEYKDGLENGTKTVYHDNGQKYYEGRIQDEKRTGTWTFWDKEGNVVKKINYDQQ